MIKPKFPKPSETDFGRELAHIYDLLQNICTFKKVRFYTTSNWTQASDGYYKLQLPSTDYVALAAFEAIEGATDKRANCVIDANAKYVTVTSTRPFDGYLVAAAVDFDDDNLLKNEKATVDAVLNASSMNAVSNRAVTLALNALMEQVQVPESLPASDVYSWAKAKNKPCYSWDEICCKPDFIQSISFKGTTFPIHKGEASLDKLAILLDIPSKMSQLVADISISDLKDGKQLEHYLCHLRCELKKIVEELASFMSETNKNVEDLEEKDEELENKLETISSDLETTKEKANANSVNVATALQQIKDCKENCSNKFEELENALNTLKEQSETEDNTLHSQLSALSHECRLHHDMYDRILEKIAGQIAELESSNVNSLIKLINQEIANIKSSVNELNEQVSTFKEETENKLSEVEDIAKSAAEDAENAQTAANTAKTTADEAKTAADAAKTTADEAKTASEEAKTSVEAIKEKVEAIPEDITELVSKVTTAGIKVEQSDTNGNIVVKTPKVDEEGKVVKDEEGNIVYEDSEVKVYRLGMPAEDDVKGQEFYDSLVTEEELSATIQAMTTTAKVSAVINYDDNNGDQYINITESSGLIWVNGQRVTLNVKKVEENVTVLQQTVEAQTQEIEDLKATIEQLWAFIGQADTNSNKTHDEGESTLGDKQEAVNAVTDEDAMGADMVLDAFNDPT